MRILCSICGAEAWGFALEQEVYRLPVPVGGQQSRAKGYIKCPGGWGRWPRLKLCSIVQSCSHTRVFVVSQQVALSRCWDLCGAPLPGRLSPERQLVS